MKIIVIAPAGFHLDYLGCYGNLWIDTSSLDALAAESTVFDKYISDCPSALGAWQAWRTGCFAGFLVGRAAAASMLSRGSGTIIFSGATGSLRGGAEFAAFASPKFALRALAQSMARELGPKGIHVAHVVLDGMIAQEDSPSESLLQPAAIAETFYQLHRQNRSAWTHELDLRPSSEKF